MADAPSAGHDPKLLDPVTDRLFVAALRGAECKAMLQGPGGEHVEVPLEGRPGEAALRGTRCFMNLEVGAPVLRDRLRPAEVAGYGVDRVNGYVSPAGCGTPLHFDVRTVCIVQLFGRKSWWVADEPAVADPSRNCVMPPGARTVRYDGRQLEAPQRLRQQVLRPGDWLIVPRGVWHKTVSEEGSVSASLAAPEGRERLSLRGG